MAVLVVVTETYVAPVTFTRAVTPSQSKLTDPPAAASVRPAQLTFGSPAGSVVWAAAAEARIAATASRADSIIIIEQQMMAARYS